MPWEERDRLGYADALIETVKLIVTAPSEAFSRLRSDGDVIWPLLFGLFFSWLGQFFNQIWNLIFGQAMRSMLEGVGDLGPFGQLTPTGLIGTVISISIWPFLFAIFILIGAGIYHLCLMLVGATNTSPTGFEGTLKVLCYVQVSNLASVIPIAGGLITMVATLVLTVIGFKEVHRTTTGSAVVAVLIPVTLCCICCVIFLVMVFGGALAAAMSAGG